MPAVQYSPCIQTTAIAISKNNTAIHPNQRVDFPNLASSRFLTRMHLNRIRQTAVITISRHATIGILQNKTTSIQIAGLDGDNVNIGGSKKQNSAESIHGTVNASVAWKNAPFAGSSRKKIFRKNCFITSLQSNRTNYSHFTRKGDTPSLSDITRSAK
ncbi:MAG: hypothetical protein J6T46_08735 [Victivallales bacterium]|nr:hypothetical protein [Victivallales bacterium]